MSWYFVLWVVVLVHVVAGVVLALFWPEVKAIKNTVFVQKWYGWIRSRVQPLISRLLDRWDAHHIADNVYLGSLPAACNLNRLQLLRVTHVVTVMIGADAVFPQHFTYNVIHVRGSYICCCL
jgi:hypothetical protein